MIKRLTKLLIIFIAIPVLMIAMLRLIYFYHPKTEEEKAFAQSLKTHVSSGKSEVKISELTHFTWDQVCLSMPYERVLDNTNQYSELKDARYNEEYEWSLVFTLQSKFVKLIRVDAIKTGFLVLDRRQKCASKKNAKFTTIPSLYPESRIYKDGKINLSPCKSQIKGTCDYYFKGDQNVVF